MGAYPLILSSGKYRQLNDDIELPATRVIQFPDGAATLSDANKGKIRYNNVSKTFQLSVDGGAFGDIATGSLTNYAYLPGRAGGQILIGGTAVTDDLVLRATAGIGTTGSAIIFQVGNNGGTEAMRILYDGKVGIGTNAPVCLLHLSQDNALGATPMLRVAGYTNTGSDRPRIYILRGCGTAASPTRIVNDNYTLGGVAFAGYYDDVGGAATSAEVQAVSEQTWSAGARGSRLEFKTTKNATATLGSRMVIDGQGFVGIGDLPDGDPVVQCRLHVFDSAYPVARDVRTSTETATSRWSTEVEHSTTSNMADGFGAGIGFALTDSGVSHSLVAGLEGLRDGADNNGALVFRTYSAGVSTEWVRIKPDGKVGIGVAAPSSRLEVAAVDAVTNTTTTLQTLTHTTSGVAAAGFGIKNAVNLENAATTSVEALSETVTWSATAAGPHDYAKYVAQIRVDAGLQNAIVIDGAGGTVLTGFQAAATAAVSDITLASQANRSDGDLLRVDNVAATKFSVSFNGSITSTGAQTVSVKKIDETASPYTIPADGYIISVTSNANNIDIYLPSAVANAMRVIKIKHTDSFAGTGSVITITSPVAGNIDGAASYVIDTDYEYVTVYSDGTNWFIIG